MVKFVTGRGGSVK